MKNTADIRSTVTQAEVKRRFAAMSAGMSAAGISIQPDLAAMISPVDSASIAITRQLAPTPISGLVEREQQDQQASRERRDAAVVDPALLDAGRGLVHLGGGDRHGERGDRHVEEEDPAPAELVGEKPAQQRAERVADAGDAEDDPAREPGAGGGKRGERHPEDRRPHQRAADAHPDASGDQPADLLRSAVEEGEGGEDRRPDEEDAPAPEHVSEAPPVTITMPNVSA